MVQNRFLGIMLTVLGVVVLAASLGELVLRLFFALFALWLINYGLRLQGHPPLIIQLSRIKHSFWF